MSIYKTLQRREFMTMPTATTFSDEYWPDTAHYAGGFSRLVKRLQLSATLKSHRGCVNTVKWNESGTRIVSGSDDTHLGIWEINNCSDGPPVDPHGYEPLSACLSHAGDTHNCRLLHRFQTRHYRNIFGARFVPGKNDDCIVSCALDHLVVYSVLSRNSSKQIARHNGAAHKFVIVDPHVYITCGEDGLCKLLDIRDETTLNLESTPHQPKNNILEVQRYDRPSQRETCYAIDLNPLNSNFFALTTRTRWTRLYDLRTLSVQTPRTDPVLKLTLPEFLNPEDNSDFIRQGATGCKFSHDGRELAVNYSGRQIAVFDLTKPQEGGGFKWFQTTPPMEMLTSTMVFEDEMFENKEDDDLENEDDNKNDDNDDDDDERKMLDENGDRDDAADDAASNQSNPVGAVTRLFHAVVQRMNPRNHSGGSTARGSNSRFPSVIRFDRSQQVGQAFRGFASRLSHRVRESTGFLGSTLSRPEEIPQYYLCKEFRGHRSIDTVKEVNFFGPRSEYVISGSDCGHAFIWDKKNGAVVNVIHGDSRITNVVQGHPSSCVLVTAGLDSDVKVWTPTADAPCDSKLFRPIIDGNTRHLEEPPDQPFFAGLEDFRLLQMTLAARGIDFEDLLRRFEEDSDDNEDGSEEFDEDDSNENNDDDDDDGVVEDMSQDAPHGDEDGDDVVT